MSFNIALSGVAAAQKDLDVTANNIANVNTDLELNSATCTPHHYWLEVKPKWATVF